MLRRGDENVENAVAVSFVEDSCVSDPRMAAFVTAWLAGLRAEVERQQSTVRPPSIRHADATAEHDRYADLLIAAKDEVLRNS